MIREIKISLVDIKAPQGAFQKYGTFGVLVRKLTDNDNKQVILERYDGSIFNLLAKSLNDTFLPSINLASLDCLMY